jgi:DNA processing protein
MGSHSLIKDGAIFVTSGADILREIGVEPAGSVEAAPEKRGRLTGTENRIVSFLNSSPVHVDDIIEGSGLNARETGSALSILEMKGKVRRLPGNHFVRIS